MQAGRWLCCAQSCSRSNPLFGHESADASGYTYGWGNGTRSSSLGYTRRIRRHHLLVRNLEQGLSLAKTLGDNAAALMRGHGCVVTGRAVRDVVRISVYLMVNARLQTEAMGFGEVTFLSENEIAATAEMSASPLAANRIWEYWVRRSGYVQDATPRMEL